MPSRRVIGLALIGLGAVAHAQDRAELELPPLPRQERFVPRDQLTVTLRPATSRLRPGERPTFSVVFQNTGTTTIRIPVGVGLGSGVVWRVVDSSGRQMRGTQGCVTARHVLPTRVRDLLALRPQQSRELALHMGCGDLLLPALPVGEYEVQANYRNYPDWPSKYDVYERGGADAWDGEVEMAPVALTVEPFDEATERRLIEGLDDGASGPNEVWRLGLNRSSAAVDGLLRRFERDAMQREQIIRALAAIGDASAAGRLGLAVERFRDPWMEFLWILTAAPLEILQLLRHSDGCDAVPLLVVTSGRVAGAAQVVEERCADLRVHLQAIRDTPLPPDAEWPERNRALHRAGGARALLEALDRPAPAPANADDTDDAWPRVPPQASGLPEYVATLANGTQFDEAFDQAVLGVTRFGTAETFAELRDALARGNPLARGRIGEALVAMAFLENMDGEVAASPAYWERWWRANGRRSRAQWAEQVLRRESLDAALSGGSTNTPVWRAAAYLVTARGGARGLVRELAAHRSWRVRLGAAEGLAAFDQRSAGRLMVRELHNRYLAPCSTAASQLQALTGTRYGLDCRDIVARQRAIVHWTSVVDALSP